MGTKWLVLCFLDGDLCLNVFAYHMSNCSGECRNAAASKNSEANFPQKQRPEHNA